MKWSWRWIVGDYVPVESGLSRRERGRLLKPIFAEQVRKISGAYGAAAGLSFAAMLGIGRHFTSMPIAFFYVMLFALALNVSFGFFIAHRTAPSVFEELRRRGIDLCDQCNYNLRGLGHDAKNCPECGAAREPLQRDGNSPS